MSTAPLPAGVRDPRPRRGSLPSLLRPALGLALGLVVPLATVAAALALLPDAARWQLDFRAVGAQPWRLLTGHLVHWSTDHLAWDLAVFLGLGLACEGWSRRRTAAALLLAVAALGAGLPLLHPGIAVYRGLSGLDAALFSLLAARCLARRSRPARWAGFLALAGLGGKVAWEAFTGTPLFLASTPEAVVVVPAAHLLGGLAGLAAGWLPIHR